MSIRFGWSDEQVKFAPQVYFLSRTIGALLGAFLLTRIAEMKYFRINIVACVVSLLVLMGVEKDVVNIVCIGAVGFFASSVFSIIYSMALQARPEKANQISGLMITAVAGGGVVTPILGFAIDLGGITAGLFVVLLCVAYLMYCAFGIKVKKVS
jgi:fucose permease